MTWLLNIPVVDTNPQTKFQDATIIGTLKSTSYQNLNLSLTGPCMYVCTCNSVHMYVQSKHYMPLASSMAGALKKIVHQEDYRVKCRTK